MDIDILPGSKTYILAGAAVAVFWGSNLGLVPADVAEPTLQWLTGLMTGTVGLKVFRVATGR